MKIFEQLGRFGNYLTKQTEQSGLKNPKDYDYGENPPEASLPSEPEVVNPTSPEEIYTPGAKQPRWERKRAKKEKKKGAKEKKPEAVVLEESSEPSKTSKILTPESLPQTEPEVNSLPPEAERDIEKEVDEQLKDAMPELAPLVKDEKRFSRKQLKEKIANFAKNKFTKDALIGFTTGTGGAMAYKYIAGRAVRAGVKYAFDYGTVGVGAAVGGLVGGSWEGGKTYVQEKKRAKQFKAELEGLHGVDKIKALCELKNKQNAEDLQGTDRQIWEELQNSRVDKLKIVKAATRGAVIGALGGAIGGVIVEYLGGGSVVHAAGTENSASKLPLTDRLGGHNWGGAHLEQAASAYASAKEITRAMRGSVWNTAKEYLKERGINKPSNALVNEATRAITEANNVEITGDHANRVAENLHHHLESGIKDIVMPEGHNLKGFEQLNDLIKQAGGNAPASEISTHQIFNLPKAGLPPKLEMQTSWLTTNKALLAVFVLELGAGGYAGKKIFQWKSKRNRTQKQDNFEDRQEMPEAGLGNRYGEEAVEPEILTDSAPADNQQEPTVSSDSPAEDAGTVVGGAPEEVVEKEPRVNTDFVNLDEPVRGAQIDVNDINENVPEPGQGLGVVEQGLGGNAEEVGLQGDREFSETSEQAIAKIQELFNNWYSLYSLIVNARQEEDVDLAKRLLLQEHDVYRKMEKNWFFIPETQANFNVYKGLYDEHLETIKACNVKLREIREWEIQATVKREAGEDFKRTISILRQAGQEEDYDSRKHALARAKAILREMREKLSVQYPGLEDQEKFLGYLEKEFPEQIRELTELWESLDQGFPVGEEAPAEDQEYDADGGDDLAEPLLENTEGSTQARLKLFYEALAKGLFLGKVVSKGRKGRETTYSQIDKWALIMSETGGPLNAAVGNGIEKENADYIRFALRKVEDFNNLGNKRALLKEIFTILYANKKPTAELSHLIGDLRNLHPTLKQAADEVRKAK